MKASTCSTVTVAGLVCSTIMRPSEGKVILITVANGMPAIAWRVFGEYFNQPLDGWALILSSETIRSVPTLSHRRCALPCR